MSDGMSGFGTRRLCNGILQRSDAAYSSGEQKDSVQVGGAGVLRLLFQEAKTEILGTVRWIFFADRRSGIAEWD